MGALLASATFLAGIALLADATFLAGIALLADATFLAGSTFLAGATILAGAALLGDTAMPAAEQVTMAKAVGLATGHAGVATLLDAAFLARIALLMGALLASATFLHDSFLGRAAHRACEQLERVGAGCAGQTEQAESQRSGNNDSNSHGEGSSVS
jgi:hypothetical protein